MSDYFQIVNTEWGAFSNGLPLTEYDREMDAESINPGEQVCYELTTLMTLYVSHEICNTSHFSVYCKSFLF